MGSGRSLLLSSPGTDGQDLTDGPKSGGAKPTPEKSLFGHGSSPIRNQETVLRHNLPIINPDLPIPSRDLNSSIQPELLNPKFLHKSPKKYVLDILTLIGEFRHGNKTIYPVSDEESDFSGPRT